MIAEWDGFVPFAGRVADRRVDRRSGVVSDAEYLPSARAAARRRDLRQRKQRAKVKGWSLDADLSGVVIPDESDFTPRRLRADLASFMGCGSRVSLQVPVVRGLDGALVRAGSVSPIGGYCNQVAVCVACADRSRVARYHSVLSDYRWYCRWLARNGRVPGNEYMVTLTVRNTDTREEGEALLKASFRRLQRLKGGEWSRRVRGGLAAYEVTRNEKTGQYHPHVHVFAVADSRIDYRLEDGETEVTPGVSVRLSKFSREWWEATGRTAWIVDVKPLRVGNRAARRVADKSREVHDAESALKYVLQYTEVSDVFDTESDYCRARLATHNKRYWERLGFFRRLRGFVEAAENPGAAEQAAAPEVSALRQSVTWGDAGYAASPGYNGVEASSPNLLSPHELDREKYVAARLQRIRGFRRRLRRLLGIVRRSVALGAPIPPWLDVPVEIWNARGGRPRMGHIRYFVPLIVPGSPRESWDEIIDGLDELVEPWVDVAAVLADGMFGRADLSGRIRELRRRWRHRHDDPVTLVAVMLGLESPHNHPLTDGRLHTAGVDQALAGENINAFLVGAVPPGHAPASPEKRLLAFQREFRLWEGHRNRVRCWSWYRDKVARRWTRAGWRADGLPLIGAAVAEMVRSAAAREAAFWVPPRPPGAPVCSYQGVPVDCVGVLDSFGPPPIFPPIPPD